MLIRLFLLSAILLISCSGPVLVKEARRLEHPERTLGAALLRGPTSQDLELARALGWEGQRSVAGERLRQQMLVGIGRRGEAFADLQRWKRDDPGHADLAYLEARLWSDTKMRGQAFREGVRRWPHHPWFNLGFAIQFVEEVGMRAEVRRALLRAGRSVDSAPLRRRARAILLQAEGNPGKALEILHEDAFHHSLTGSLDLSHRIAQTSQQAEVVRQISSERQRLILLPSDSEERRVRVVFHRLAAELPIRSDPTLDSLLLQLDEWCEQAELPSGFHLAPRLQMGPLAELVRPEAVASEPWATFLRHGFMPLMGSRADRGVCVVLLSGVDVLEVPWPGSEHSLVLFLADSAETLGMERAAGASLFRGFFLRADLGLQQAESLSKQLAKMDPWRGTEIQQVPEHGGWPEDFDLDQRLQVQSLAQSNLRVEDLLFQDLLLHESGHLPESVPVADGVLPWVTLLAPSLRSLLTTGDPLVWPEFRAQARALAWSPHPAWTLASTIQLARNGPPRYQMAYRNLLAQLRAVAKDEGAGPWHTWDTLEEEHFRRWGQEVCRRRGMDLPPVSWVEPLLRAAMVRDRTKSTSR